MDINALSESFATFFTAGGLGGVLLLGICLAWGVHASGSAHPLRLRALRLIYGKTDIRNEAVAGFLDDQMSLAWFRASSGLGRQIRSSAQMKRLIEWMDAHDEDIGCVRQARFFFDFESPGIVRGRLYSLRSVLGVSLLSSLLCAAVFAAFAGALSSDALVRVRKTGEWLHLSPDSAVAFGGGWLRDVEPLTPALCDLKSVSIVAETTGLSADSIQIVCRTFGAFDVEVFVDEAVLLQRQAFALLTLALTLCLLECGRWLLSGIAAHRMVARSDKRPSKRILALTAIAPDIDDPDLIVRPASDQEVTCLH